MKVEGNLDVKGDVLTDGTVDGRDVDADGTAQDTHIADATKHRIINDASTAATELLSANEIDTRIAAGGGGSAVAVHDDGGAALTTGVTKFDFIGGGVTASDPVADEIDVTITRVGVYRNVWLDGGAATSPLTAGCIFQGLESVTNNLQHDLLVFDFATEQNAQWRISMPSDWNRGTIKYKVYWKGAAGCSNGDVVKVGVKATSLGDDDLLDPAWGTEILVTDTVLNIDGDLQVSAASGALTVGGTPADGDLVYINLARKAADAADTMNAENLQVLGIMIQYLEDSTEIGAW